MTKETTKLMGQNLPGKPVVSYPYNTIDDIELTEVIDTDGPNYQVLTEGTPYPDPEKYPDHVLIFQEPIDNRNLRRVYLNISAVQWEDEESIAVQYPELFQSYIFVVGIGSAWQYTASRTRTVAAQSVFTLSIGQTTVPQSSLWNPKTQSWRLWVDFSATNAITNGFIYSGVVNGIAFEAIVPPSSPTLDQYLAMIAANDTVLYQYESKRWKQNIFSNKSLYIPVL
jgi:hypothetical protein